MTASTTRTPSSYADRAVHYRREAAASRRAGDLEVAARLEELAQRAEHTHTTRSWQAADDLRYGPDDCCTECEQHLSDPHDPGCVYADLAYAHVAE
ncbi:MULTISPECIES: hypothetical protein [Nocardiaceae]|uniref:Uncharacterized protein n=1 Tax=Williamsia limnetica TaxID=882452 RepID=A0A318RDM4_WILLI|nr:hypothetical protein [Williamsia limnetica]PYE12000.1 hypothetical protein DFR67_1268 [Williamsia limnetica]